MAKVKLLFQYLYYKLFSKHAEGFRVDTAVIYEFVFHVLNKKSNGNDLERIEKYREEISNNNNFIEITDFGAGSKKLPATTRKIRDIARTGSVNKKFGSFLYRCTKYYKPQYVIELGTSLGISTLYLAAGNPQAKVFSIEGNPKAAKIASENFIKSGFENIKIINEKFDDALPELIKKLDNNFLAFVDGNHRKESVLKYFDLLSGKANRQSIVIFDDIRWSSEMFEAWNIIKEKKEVKVSVDLFFMGIVFFSSSGDKQHFVIDF